MVGNALTIIGICIKIIDKNQNGVKSASAALIPVEVLPMEMKKINWKPDKKQLIAIGAGALAVLVLVLALVLLPGNIRKELTVEAGTEAIAANDFRKEDKGIDAEFVSDLTAVDLNTPGEYPVKVRYKNKTHSCTVAVVDTTAPTATVRNVAVYAGHSLKPEAFVSGIVDCTEVTVSWKPEPDLTKEAQTLMTIILTDAAGNKTEYEAVLSVFVDTVQPQLEGVGPVFTYISTEPDYLDGVIATDDRDVALQIRVDDSKVDLGAVGTYDITYSVTDAAGNTVSVPTTLTVTDDDVLPSILGVHPLSLYTGTAASFDSNIQVRDDKDPAPRLTVDDSKVDTAVPGTYPLVYTARDMTGNKTQIQTTVTVVQKPENYVQADVINAKADELLQKIVTENMTAEAKAKAIYSYVRSHYTYGGTSARVEWMQDAYAMMSNGQGDFYNYFALTKLLLERCGIPNIDVRRTPNADGVSEHAWSMVSVDGGKTYYHLDATPRSGDGDDFCLVSDSFLDAYSSTHNGTHTRDADTYPATGG